MKKILLKNLLLSAILSAEFAAGALCQSCLSMDESFVYVPDRENGLLKETKINLAQDAKIDQLIGFKSDRITHVSTDQAIRVAVIDQIVNPEAAIMAKSYIQNQIPSDYDFKVSSHGTHVLNTIRQIYPNGQFHSYDFKIDTINNVHEKCDVINMSFGPSSKRGISAYEYGGYMYAQLVAAANQGKIMIKSFGNEFDDYKNNEKWAKRGFNFDAKSESEIKRNEENIKKYIRNDLGFEEIRKIHNRIMSYWSREDNERFMLVLMNLAKNPVMKGRLIIVAACDKNDVLGSFSNRAIEECLFVITAPGVDINAQILKEEKKIAAHQPSYFNFIQNFFQYPSSYKEGIETRKESAIYSIKDGTSMATPIVTGVIADLLERFSKYKDIFGDEIYKDFVVQAVLNGARKISFKDNTSLSSEFGQGIINHRNAENILQSIFKNEAILKLTADLNVKNKFSNNAEFKNCYVKNIIDGIKGGGNTIESKIQNIRRKEKCLNLREEAKSCFLREYRKFHSISEDEKMSLGFDELPSFLSNIVIGKSLEFKQKFNDDFDKRYFDLVLCCGVTSFDFDHNYEDIVEMTVEAIDSIIKENINDCYETCKNMVEKYKSSKGQ